jgi:hypothetical protein
MKENLLRGESCCAKNARKTHCSSGHQLVDGNLYRSVDRKGRLGRICRTCKINQVKQYAARRA